MLTYIVIAFNIYLRILLCFEHHDSFLITVKWTVLANQRNDQCYANQGDFFQITQDQHQCHLDCFGQYARVFSPDLRPGSVGHCFSQSAIVCYIGGLLGHCEEL